MGLRGLFTGPVTVRSLLMILLLVGSATGVNALLTPPEMEPETVPAEAGGEVVSDDNSGNVFWNVYQENDILFFYPKWMTLREVALENNTVMEGALHGTVNGAGQYTEAGVEHPDEEVIAIWKPSDRFDSIDEAMEYAFQVKEIGNVSFKGAPESMVLSKQIVHYRRYSCLTEGKNERSGVAFVWNCTNSERVFILHVIHPGDEFQWRGVKFSYDVFLNFFFRCHTGKTPTIHRKTEEEKRWEKIYEWIGRISLIPVFSLLCIGFTLTYKMEGFPNIAHVHYASIGSMLSWTLCTIFGMNPYDVWPITALMGGLLAVLLYLVVFQPIAVSARHWNRPVVLTFAFLAIAYMIMSLLGMFNYYTRNVLGLYSTGFGIGDPIFIYFGGFVFSGIMIIGMFIFMVLILGLRYFLYHTNFGTGILATAEDERLAMALGISTYRVHIVSWFISGALSAWAGSMMSMSTGVDVYTADDLLVRVMAGSVLGGLDSFFGSIIGGAFLALGPEVLGDFMFQMFGFAADSWRGIYPMVFLVVILMIAPNGLTGLFSKISEWLKQKIR